VHRWRLTTIASLVVLMILGGRATAQLVQPLSQAPVSPSPSVEVTGFEQLAHLVEGDPVTAPRANSLWHRRVVGAVVGVSGAAVGVGIISVGLVQRQDSCSTCRNLDPRYALAGLGVVVASLIATALISPGRDDLVDVVRAWNLRHEDRLLTVPKPINAWQTFSPRQ
jgi:hypothetical protein